MPSAIKRIYYCVQTYLSEPITYLNYFKCNLALVYETNLTCVTLTLPIVTTSTTYQLHHVQSNKVEIIFVVSSLQEMLSSG